MQASTDGFAEFLGVIDAKDVDSQQKVCLSVNFTLIQTKFFILFPDQRVGSSHSKL